MSNSTPSDRQHKYSNPRMGAVVENWPSGSKRVTARFEIEQHAKRGERGVRTTTGAPKKLTYGRLARIVDGDDGKIYVAVLADVYSTEIITIYRGECQYSEEWLSRENPRFAAVRKLFEVGG